MTSSSITSSGDLDYSLRRSCSVPARAAYNDAPESADGVETLFTHTFAKVVSFTVSTPAFEMRSPTSHFRPDVDHDVEGNISWTSPTERTISAGPLRIYRVPGSVSFLHSGSLLHAILPRSQCWCVDGVSKFVLRVRFNSYYRIELPNEGVENTYKLEEFSAVLDKVLQYERTACPFKRSFHVELPQAASQGPVRIQPRITSPQRPIQRAKRWKFDGVWELEGSAQKHQNTDILPVSQSPHLSSRVDKDDFRFSDMNRDEQEDVETTMMLDTPWGKSSPRPRSLSSNVSYSRSSTQSRTVTPPNSPGDSFSVTSSADSFYSFGTSASASPGSLPFLDPLQTPSNTVLTTDMDPDTGGDHHRPEIPDTGVLRASQNIISPPSSEGSSTPSTPTLLSDTDDDAEQWLPEVGMPPESIRLRRLTGASHRRGLSPMPPPIHLFTPSIPRRKSFTTAMIHKTCALLLGPPATLVALMLRIAARIASGALNIVSIDLRKRKENKVVYLWDSSGDETKWPEDDYGIPLQNLRSSYPRSRQRGSFWEVD